MEGSPSHVKYFLLSCLGSKFSCIFSALCNTSFFYQLIKRIKSFGALDFMDFHPPLLPFQLTLIYSFSQLLQHLQRVLRFNIPGLILFFKQLVFTPSQKVQLPESWDRVFSFFDNRNELSLVLDIKWMSNNYSDSDYKR